MERGWYLRLSVVLVAIVVGWLALWPSLPSGPGAVIPAAPEWVRNTFPGRINPGLDIRGGLRLMYEVEVGEYIRDQRNRKAEGLYRQAGVLLELYDEETMDTLSEAQLAELQGRVSMERVGESSIRMNFQDAEDAQKVTRDWVKDVTGDTLVRDGAGTSGATVMLRMRDEVVDDWRDNAVRQAVHTISNRIDTMGLREATVMGRDSDIIVEVPGADEAAFDHIRSIISRTARLEFNIVDDAGTFPPTPNLPEGIERTSERAPVGQNRPPAESQFLVATGPESRQQLQDYIDTLDVPEGRTIVTGRVDTGTDEVAWRTWYLIERTEVTGESISDAFINFDQTQGNQPAVSIQFKRDGATAFEAMTGANIQRRMAIVLDNRVESAPVIQDRIGGGRAQITLGSYLDYQTVLQEARDLVVVLKAGALPAPLRPANEQLIGPTLGQDSITMGARGAVIGVSAVLLFMAFYYQVAGLIANLMVVMNLMLQLAILAAFEATLTLPGIAAMALTVGMAVDANVLVTERIREELRLGKSARSSVDQGFSRALSAVFDGQITTFIAGVVLFQYGTGPIKGFAVMLMIGIVTSLFTGIFCSKVVLDWVVRGLRVQRLRVG